MSTEVVFTVLFVVAAGVAILARRIRVPYTVALVVAGVVLGSLELLQPPHLTKELLFSLFLPGLVFEAAFHLEFREFRRNALPIVALAVPGVVVSMLATALGVRPIVNALAGAPVLSWTDALVFGALIAATDPIAVVALFRSLGAPRRLTVLLEGESLLNDGTAVVLFTLILGLASGANASAGSLVGSFVAVVGGGVLIGAGVGLALAQVIRRVDEAMIEITLTTIAAWGSFALADAVGASGVIATVVAGMVAGSYAARTGMSPSTRVAVETFWDYVAFAFNSIVFLLIGFEVRHGDVVAAWAPILAAYLVVTAARALLVAGVQVGVSRRPERYSPRWGTVLTWGGLRGAISMVLALSLPQTPERPLLVTLTFGVVLLSLLVNGLSMAPLLRRLGLIRRREEWEAHDAARGQLQAANAGLAEIERMARQRLAHPEVLDRLREEYQAQLEDAAQRLDQLHVERRGLREEELRRARRHLLLVEKTRIIEAFRRGALSREAQERVLADIDARLFELESGEADEERDGPERRRD